MKDGVGRFASFTLGVANSAAHSASPSNARTHARTHGFKVRSDGSHAAVTANTKIQLCSVVLGQGKCRKEFH